MSDSIYRPLVVMVEAVEAEAKRKLEAQRKRAAEEPLLGTALTRDLTYVVSQLRKRDDVPKSLTIDATGITDGWVLSYRCRTCPKRHTEFISGESAMYTRGQEPQEFVDFVFAAIDRLLDQPCTVELGHVR